MEPVDPPFADPAATARLDAVSLRGLAHPLRMRLLAALREDGPATATMLARRAGESTGATSYHLRQLAHYGFVVEDRNRGTARERWWRAAQRYTWLDVPETPRDPGEQALAEGYLRAVADAHAARERAWVDGLATVDRAWREAATLSDFLLRLTPEEARALIADLYAVVARYREHDPERAAPAGTEAVVVQLEVLPRLAVATGGDAHPAGDDATR